VAQVQAPVLGGKKPKKQNPYPFSSILILYIKCRNNILIWQVIPSIAAKLSVALGKEVREAWTPT
jgi:hypothetical protein